MPSMANPVCHVYPNLIHKNIPNDKAEDWTKAIHVVLSLQEVNLHLILKFPYIYLTIGDFRDSCYLLAVITD
jgi:hypothetical protein